MPFCPRAALLSVPVRVTRDGALDRVAQASAALARVSGIDPGFLADLLAPVLVGTCVSVDRVTVRETFNYATYHAPHAVKELVGFGLPMDSPPPMLWPTSTIALKAGSRPSGSNWLFASLSACRSRPAEAISGFPVE